MTGRLGIDDVTPTVSGGRHPSKAVVGEFIPITATVWREGHDAVAANVVWRRVGSQGAAHHVRMQPIGTGTDRFAATVVPDDGTTYTVPDVQALGARLGSAWMETETILPLVDETTGRTARV